MLYIGDAIKTYEACKLLCGDSPVYSLAYENVVSNLMKRGNELHDYDGKLDAKMLEVDPPSSGTKNRGPVVLSYIKAVELARQLRFKEAIHEIERWHKWRSDKEALRKEALQSIVRLLAGYPSYANGTLFSFFEKVKQSFNAEISGMKAGPIKTFYEGHTYQQIAVCVRIVEDNSLHRTIHKSKGAEFDNVLVIVPESKALDFLWKPDLHHEAHRVYYVAMSRARDHLFFHVPALTSAQRNSITASGVVVVDVGWV